METLLTLAAIVAVALIVQNFVPWETWFNKTTTPTVPTPPATQTTTTTPSSGTPEISILQFSFLGLGVMLIFTFIIIVAIQIAGFDWSPLYLLLIGTIALWWSFWKKEEEKKDSSETPSSSFSSKVTNAIPDGHVAIVEFLGRPRRWFILTEGNLWKPWGFSFKALDLRETTFIVPEEKESDGATAKTRDGVAVVFKVSVPARINRDRLIEALFDRKPGAIKDGLRSAILSSMRTFIAGRAIDELIINKDKGASDQVREEASGSVSKRLATISDSLCLTVAADRLEITKLDFDPKDKSLQEAREAKVRAEGSNQGVQAIQKAFDERVDQLVRAALAHNVDPAEAHREAIQQARLEFKQSTLQEIKTGGGANLLINPTTPPTN